MLKKEYICRRVLFYFVSKEDLMIINKYFKSFINKGRIRYFEGWSRIFL